MIDREKKKTIYEKLMDSRKICNDRIYSFQRVGEIMYGDANKFHPLIIPSHRSLAVAAKNDLAQRKKGTEWWEVRAKGIISPRTIHYRYGRSSILGPITNSHSRIKSRIVIQHSSCIIIRYIGEYSSSMYRIILPALLSCCANPPRDRDPVFRFILSFYLPSFPSLLFAFFRSNK